MSHDVTLFVSQKDDTHFTVPRRVEGWVDSHGDGGCGW